MSIEFDIQRYFDACHQMQTGVKFSIELGSDEATPKHLRVGVNSAMVEHAALISLLVQKGIITKGEYFRELRIHMEHEVERYKKLLKEATGKDVDLI